MCNSTDLMLLCANFLKTQAYNFTSHTFKVNMYIVHYLWERLTQIMVTYHNKLRSLLKQVKVLKTKVIPVQFLNLYFFIVEFLLFHKEWNSCLRRVDYQHKIYFIFMLVTILIRCWYYLLQKKCMSSTRKL